MTQRFAVARAGLVLALVSVEVGFAPGFTVFHQLLAALLFLSLGLPHGALDDWMWRRSLPNASRSTFFIGYLAFAGLFAAVWALVPAGALTLFLLASVMHFGTTHAPEPMRGRDFLRVSNGLLVVGLPLVCHETLAQPVLEAMTGRVLSVPDGWSGPMATALVVQNLIALAVAHGPTAKRTLPPLVESTVLIASFVILHPLLSFTLYFTLWHAVAHLREMKDRFARRDETWLHLLQEAGPFASAAVLGLLGLVGLSWSFANGALTIERAAAIGLVVTSILTAPHAVAVSLSRRAATPGRA